MAKKGVAGFIAVKLNPINPKVIILLRDPIKNMGQENQTKAMKYIQNLSKISALF